LSKKKVASAEGNVFRERKGAGTKKIRELSAEVVKKLRPDLAVGEVERKKSK